ncbi:MAG TPA: nucleotidyltransferase domain-containing protein [Mucilaginibacter sp.]|jgi:predicted nucleotidyltransferase|nr:nucleotidyltransferase domain-containing protein [Mucilaginibacter sp.]
MSINNKLINFAQKELVLAHSATERDRIKRSLANLENILADKLGNHIAAFVRFGSYTRNTILPRKYDLRSDIDLLVIFNTETVHYAPDTYRKWLLDVINKAYPNSVSKKNAPAVKLELNHIMFDIVPAYYIAGRKNIINYYIPGKGGAWQSTVPNDINEALSKINQDYGGNIYRNVIRLCKHWNAGYGYPYQSYLLEKYILSLKFRGGKNTEACFLEVMAIIAKNMADVNQALRWIKEYGKREEEEKQVMWLQKLLPEFGY